MGARCAYKHLLFVEVDKIIRIVLSSLGPMSLYIHELVS